MTTTITHKRGDTFAHTVLLPASVADGYFDGRAVPRTCSPSQGLVALYALKGITEDALLAAIDAVPDAQARYQARIAATRAVEWRRDSAALHGMAQLLGLSDADLDAMFSFAATVTV